MRKTFAQLLADPALLADQGAALANMQLHAGWPVLVGVLERLESSTLERLAQCDEGELRRLQGERDAVLELRRWIEQLPTIAGERLAQASEDGEIEDDEVDRFRLRIGDGEIGV
jgi:hypothetical protein